MYLKCLEINGFKSFADKTHLEFENGMTAVVGPNGCGKSNIGDAIRWVLGEQSAKALRGARMEDVIFTGTDTRKPLGMAEVSITFADCEELLKTEYNEVTVTRRVFRSGESQYLLNKVPCRLKDIQRMFMDTGVGTDSYSLMEQGRIDQVLSSRPEDRREIFEEASGISKFKADRKEAFRKLEQTEANLLRLADVIREVRRQIGSLQRQAGKARRYKELKEQLRGYDLALTRDRVREFGTRIESFEEQVRQLDEDVRSSKTGLQATEAAEAARRTALRELDERSGSVAEAIAVAQKRLDHMRDLVQLNTQRIQENLSWQDRDTREIDRTRQGLEELREKLARARIDCETTQTGVNDAQAQLARCQESYQAHQQQIDTARAQVQQTRERSIALENSMTRGQHRLMEMDNADRAAALQRTRLEAERTRLQEQAADYAAREVSMQEALTAARGALATAEQDLAARQAAAAAIEREVRELRERLQSLQEERAARSAQADLLRESLTDHEGLPEAARMLFDAANPLGIDPTAILGDLASQLQIPRDYLAAVQAALRPWLDVVVVHGPDKARAVLDSVLAKGIPGGLRLFHTLSDCSDAAPEGSLAAQIGCPPGLRRLVNQMLGHVRVVETLADVPAEVPPHASYVTRTGTYIAGIGLADVWSAEPGTLTPLARKQQYDELCAALESGNAALAAARERMQQLGTARQAAETEIESARARLQEHGRSLAGIEAELRLVTGEAAQARDRLETVSFELTQLVESSRASVDARHELARQIAEFQKQREETAASIAAQVEQLHVLERRQGELHAELIERKVRFAEATQQLAHIRSQVDADTLRVREMEQAVQSRFADIEAYRNTVTHLQGEIEKATTEAAALETDLAAQTAVAAELKHARTAALSELDALAAELTRQREALEATQSRHSTLDVALAENRMRRQNQLDRVSGEYGMDAENLARVPDPQWENDVKPAPDALDTLVTELRTRLEGMGPVNLVAIEEHQELEERLAFLTQNEDDLVKAKTQLHEMIRQINQTSAELFQTTFHQVNANFEQMFTRLFNGGTAKLVLVDEQDILESGIEIIARPPGKRLQNVSLLSGGERTMTAVALLFSIYMIKPSPFCLLDELDAALDESNIGRFVAVLKDFLHQSQFLVITHNRQTIATASTIYGVTMREKGVSEIVSMRFSENRQEPVPVEA